MGAPRIMQRAARRDARKDHVQRVRWLRELNQIRHFEWLAWLKAWKDIGRRYARDYRGHRAAAPGG